MTTRLEALLASAERMAGGDVDHRAEISPAHDEVDALALALNVIVGELSFAAGRVAQAKEEAELRSAQLAAAQSDLVVKERLATLGQLAGGVAHQIRNPLAAIMNATFVLKRHLPLERHAHVDDAVRVIHEEIRHADAIIAGLLDYARVRVPVRRPTAISELVDRVVAATVVAPSIEVERLIAADLPLVDVDPDQLREVLTNLVRNAVEAMADAPDARGRLVIDASIDGEVLRIAVTDDGKGIAPEIARHLFEPLRSTKPFGVGLGLVTAQAFVEAHGGRIVSIPVARGACFELRLPYRR